MPGSFQKKLLDEYDVCLTPPHWSGLLIYCAVIELAINQYYYFQVLASRMFCCG